MGADAVDLAKWLAAKWELRANDFERVWAVDGNAITAGIKPGFILQAPMPTEKGFDVEGRISVGLAEVRLHTAWHTERPPPDIALQSMNDAPLAGCDVKTCGWPLDSSSRYAATGAGRGAVGPGVPRGARRRDGVHAGPQDAGLLERVRAAGLEP